MRHTLQVVGELSELFGTLDENLKLFESSFHVTIHPWNNNLEVEGDASHVRRAVNVLEEYNHRVREGRPLGRDEVKSLLHLAASDPDNEVREAFSPLRNHLSGKKNVIPKGPNQRLYMEALETHDMVFATGPAGTGKTYLAVAKAVSALLSKQVSRIVLARPAVEAGERLGFLPGTLYEKIDPYLRPLYDALRDMLDPDTVPRLLTDGVIEVAPLAYMRGRSLPVTTNVLTPGGFRPIGQLQVG